MSEDKKSLINLVPEALDNAAKNLTDKPTQNIGTTLADIWYLVFGGISQAAEKRKLKYSYALQEFQKELKDKISKIPEDKLVEPNIQIVAPALEASKYCIEKEELRHMFAKLIQSSLSSDFSYKVHPSFSHIISSLSPADAKILLNISKNGIEFNNINILLTSLSILSQLGLIYYEQKGEKDISKIFESVTKNKNIKGIHGIRDVHFSFSEISFRVEGDDSKIYIQNISLTKLGYDFVTTCT